MPFMFGMSRSVTTTSGGRSSAIFVAATPSSADSTT